MIAEWKASPFYAAQRHPGWAGRVHGEPSSLSRERAQCVGPAPITRVRTPRLGLGGLPRRGIAGLWRVDSHDSHFGPLLMCIQ